MKTDNMSDVVTDIRDAIGDETGITLTGASAISKDINTASQKDLITAEAIGLPIAIIVFCSHSELLLLRLYRL